MEGTRKTQTINPPGALNTTVARVKFQTSRLRERRLRRQERGQQNQSQHELRTQTQPSHADGQKNEAPYKYDFTTHTQEYTRHEKFQQQQHPDANLRRQVVGAVMVGSVAGLMLGGPSLCLLCAGGAAALATSDHRAGRIARETGDLIAEGLEQLQACETDYHISQKAWQGATQTYVYAAQRIHRHQTVRNNEHQHPQQ